MFAEGFEKAAVLDALICIPVSSASILLALLPLGGPGLEFHRWVLHD